MSDSQLLFISYHLLILQFVIILWLIGRLLKAWDLAPSPKAILALRMKFLIDELRAEEGESVTIHSDNPDFEGPNSCIEITDIIGSTENFHSETVLDCLEVAYRFKTSTRDARPPKHRSP